MESEQVVLVDESDNEVGVCEKIEAHEHGGRLHRAFSIFVFDAEGRWLLQQRALAKYHFPGLWTNTCCSHPRPGETVPEAAHRKLVQEMGFDCPLTERFHFVYRAVCASDLTEHELDHVLTGMYEGPILANPDEVAAWRWIRPDDLQTELREHPEAFTPWFKIAMSRVAEPGLQGVEIPEDGHSA